MISRTRIVLPTLLLLILSASEPLCAEIRSADCAKAARYSEGKRGISMLVIQNGRTLFERYASGATPDGRWPIFSGTKSFWGVAALIAVSDGLLKMDEHVCDTITEWRSNARKSQITIRQLLTFTDGIEGASQLHRETIRDRNKVAIRLPLVAPPGSVFIYGPSHLQVFSEVLRRKLGGRSPTSYLEQHVLGPLGISNLEYKRDAHGNPLLASGFELSAREWARLGQLVLRHGNYQGRKIVRSDLLAQAFVGSTANPAYGLTFWLNRSAGLMMVHEVDIEKHLELPWQRASWRDICICKSAPTDMIVALGSGYQRLFIIPSMNALIVRQGQNAKFSDAYFLRLVLGRT